MTQTCFVFASKAEKSPESVIKKYIPESVDDYDIHFLCSDNKEKILKKDIDMDISILDDYKLVCPIGAESLKYTAGMTGITKYNGVHIEKKYLPIMHPNLIVFKPQYEDEIIKAFNKIPEILSDEDFGKTVDKDYRIIDNQHDYEEYLCKLRNADTIVVDIETSSLSPRTGHVLGIALSTQVNEGIYVLNEVIEATFDEETDECELHDIFRNSHCVFHNAKFDMGFLIYEYGFEFPSFDDTMLLHYSLEEAVGTHGLKPLALRFTDLGDYERELDEYKKTFARKNKIKLEDFNYGMLPVDILGPYACKDADGTFQLYEKFKPLVANNQRFNKLYNDILVPATKSLMLLENNGGPIDVKALESLDENYAIDIEECQNEIFLNEAVQRFERIYEKTFNPNSTAQLRELFFTILKLKPTKKTATGAWSVDKEVLQELKHPLAEAVLDLREKNKLRGTYIANILKGIDKDERLRSGFNIQGTTSGRLSSSGVLNYQNIPRDNKDIKKMFKARPGFTIVQGDLGTAEVYYAAALSGDRFLQKAFIDKLDFHSYVAKQIFNLPCEIQEVKSLFPDKRQHAKAITFGIMYQAGPAKVAETAEVETAEARLFINKYFKEARELKKFIDSSNTFIENNAYIYSFFGRKRRLPEAKSTNQGVAKHAIRSGVNFLVQSVASDINLLGLIELTDWIKQENIGNQIIPFTVVHDSIVSEVKEELVDDYIVKVKEFIQKDRGCSIPDCPIGMDFELGPSWGELKDY